MRTIRIAPRYNGPPGSGNGGYTCGIVALAMGEGPAEVTLRSPPPLDRDLEVRHDGEGSVAVLDGDHLVAEGRQAAVEVPETAPVPLDRASEVADAGLPRWSQGHPFPTCFVCGPDRSPGDGLCIFPADLGDGRFVSTWTPEADTSDPEHVWAALDCPTSAPGLNPGGAPPVVLARLAAHIDAPVTVGKPHVLVSWELGREGRKREAACVLFDAEDVPIARSRALWIELRGE